MGLPEGGLLVLAGVRAETEAARARTDAKIVESMVMFCRWSTKGRMLRGLVVN